MWLRYFLLRVTTHVVAYLTLPLVWWYSPKTLLSIIKFNDSRLGELASYVASSAPAPWDYYGKLILDAGDAVARIIRLGLLLVPNEAQDHVEVLIRLRYDLGGGMLIIEAIGALTLFYWIMRRRKRRIRISPEHQRQEPTFETFKSNNTRRNE